MAPALPTTNREQYVVQASSPTCSWTTYDAPVDLAAGSHTIDYRGQGTNLQWSETRTLEVEVDDTAPAVEAFLVGRSVTLTATDADSGTALVFYRLDGGSWTTYDAPVVVDEYPHTVEYWATDVAGNGVPVAGATRQQYLLATDDLGHRFAVEVTAARAGALPGVATSEPTAAVTDKKGS